jgi:glycosyltransferase involved in cell wall biosynthesis
LFNERTLSSPPAVSPAANRWQLGLIRGLHQSGAKVSVCAHLPEPVWPKGRLWVGNNAGELPKDISGTVIGYLNLPVLRHSHLARGFFRSLAGMRQVKNGKGVVVTYNAPPGATHAARRIRDSFKVPWVCVVADGEAPEGADGYVFLSWGYFRSFDTNKPKLHLDGGTSRKKREEVSSGKILESKPKVVMYTGAFSKYGGAAELIKAFQLLTSRNLELWLTGKGSGAEIRAMASRDKRIKLFGFVDESALEEMLWQADVLVNPRPSNIVENQWNFPSKVLEYLSFGKPVVSTWTDGLSPEYRELLVVVKSEDESGLAEALEEVLEWSPAQKESSFKRAAEFCESHTWKVQAERLVDWIMEVRL